MVVFRLLRFYPMYILGNVYLSGATWDIFISKRRLINVILFLIFVFGGNMFSSTKGADDAKKCTEYKRFNISIMDCTRLSNLEGLPKYLSANIQGLNLSFSRASWTMDNNTFVKFKDSLLLLDHSHTFPSLPNSFAIYRVLSKLEYLDISSTCIYHPGMIDGTFQAFPNSLKVLKFNECPIEYLDIQYLILLEELHMSSSHLKVLPRINITAPIKFLDLAENELYTLSPMDFTKFCTLREVILNSASGHGLNQPKYYCECISLKNWFANKITKASMACTSPSPTPDCDTTRLDDANAVYADSCLPRAKWKWWLVLPSIILLLLLSILTIAYSVNMVIRRRQQSVIDEESIEEPMEEEEEEVETLEESTDIMTHMRPKTIPEMY